MANTPEFVAHALDLLAPLGVVTARSMFGGHGLYARGVMFGLLDDEELFLRADDEARPVFLEAGCRQWSYPSKGGPVPGDYWRPPDEAHEEAEAMRPWGELGLAAALRRAASKAAKGKAKGKAAPARGKAGARAKPGAKAKPKGAASARPAGKPAGKPSRKLAGKVTRRPVKPAARRR